MLCTSPPLPASAGLTAGSTAIVQTLEITSLAPQNEIQVVSIETAAPDGAEVQEVSTKGWGTTRDVISVPRVDPDVRLIFVNGSAPITGTFAFSVDGTSFVSVAWNASAADMQTALQSPGFFETVEVDRRRLDQTPYPYGDGYGWLVTFISEAGSARTLTFDTRGITPFYRNDVKAGSIVLQVATSTKLGGSFQLGYQGVRTVDISFNAAAGDVQTAMMAAFSNVLGAFTVTRSAADPNNAYTWSITFLPSNATHARYQRLEVDPTRLTGTRASAAVVTRRPGSTLAGTFRIGLDGHFTTDLTVRCSAEEVEQSLELLPLVGDVTVRRVTGQSSAWLVEFLDLKGQVELLATDNANVTGADAKITAVRQQRGIAPLKGGFRLQIEDQWTPLLSVDASASLLQRALQPITGDYIASATAEAAMIQSGMASVVRRAWHITYPLPRSPHQLSEHCASLPVVRVDVTQVVGVNVKGKVDWLSAACVRVHVYMSSVDDALDESRPLYFGVAAVPHIDRVYPPAGPSSGGTLLTLVGSSIPPGTFLSCVFGTLETSAVFINTTTVSCLTPAIQTERTSAIYVSLKSWNDDAPGEFMLSSTAASFKYYDEIEINGFAPSHGPNRGGTVVTLTGRGFLNVKSLSCRFTVHLPQRSDPLIKRVQGAFLSEDGIACVAPSLTDAFADSGLDWVQHATASADIEVSNNGEDFVATWKSFMFARPIEINSVQPSAGPLQGGTAVTVSARWPTPFPITHCRFGKKATPAQASTVANDSVVCVSPAQVLRPTIVALTVNMSSLLSEVQVVTTHASSGSTIDGFFTLRLGRSSTRPIAWNAPATGSSGDSMMEILRDLPSASVASVTRVGPDPQGGFAWSITFERSSGNVEPLQADAMMLANDDNFVTVTTTSDGPAIPVYSDVQRVQILQVGLLNPSILLRMPLITPVQEVQQVSITSTKAISGSFTTSYVGLQTSLVSWDVSSASLTEALSAVPGVGVIIVTRMGPSSGFGFAWQITFVTATPSARPLLTVTTTSLSSTAPITSTVTRVSTGTFSLTGSFVLGLTTSTGNVISSAISFDASAGDLTASISAVPLSLRPLAAKKLVSASEISWNVTFAVFDTSASKLFIASSSLTGTTGLLLVDKTALGAPVGGSLALTLLTKKSIDIAVTTSPSSLASTIQQELVNLALSATVGVQVSVVAAQVGNTTLELKFVDSVGDVPQVVVDSSKLSGPGVQAAVSTMRDGNYAPLGGSFALATSSSTTPALNAVTTTTAQLQTAIAGLVASPSVSLVSMSPVPTGNRWLMTFSSAVDPVTLAQLTVKQPSTLSGTGAVAFLEVVDPGQDLDVSVSLSSNNATDFSSSTATFSYRLPVKVVSIQPVNGPLTGRTAVTVALAAVLPAAAEVQCRFGSLVVAASKPLLSNSTFVCLSPETTAPGTVRVDVSLNGADFDVFAGWFEFRRDESSRFRLWPASGTTSGGTLVAISGSTFQPLNLYACRFGSQTVAAEQVNQTHVSCRTPAVAAPMDVAVTVSANAIDFTAFDLSFSYENLPFVSRIFPFTGNIEGGNTIDIYGGNFVSRKSGRLACRFGDAIVDATIVSTANAQCVAPKLQMLPEIQQLALTNAPLVPEVQQIVITADPLVPTVQRVSVTGGLLQPEIQEFRVFGDATPEIQRIEVASQAFNGESFSIKTSISPVVAEVQAIELRATSFIGGSFTLLMEDHETVALPSYASAAQVKSALEALPNTGSVTVARTTRDGTGSCFWEIQFDDRAGDLPLLRLRNLTLMDSGTQDLRVRVFELTKGQGSPLVGSFQLVINGSTTPSIVYDANESMVASAIARVEGPGFDVAVARIGPKLNNAFEWIVTFVGLPAGVRTLGSVSASLAGGVGQVSITLVYPGAKSEQQQITTSMTGGTFVCMAQTRTSSAISFDGSAQQVQDALVNAGAENGLGRVAVAGNGGGPWVVTFLEWAGDLPLLDCGPQQTVLELVAGSGAPLGGSFLFGYGSQWAPALGIGATAAQVQAAISSLSFVGAVSVSTVGTNVNGGGIWYVTFASADGDPELLVVNTETAGLSGELGSVSVAEQQQGNQVRGHVRLNVTSDVGSDRFALDASVEDIRNALAALPSVVSLSRTNDLPAHGIKLTVTFSTSLGNLPLLTLVQESDVSGAGVVSQATTVQDGTPLIDGTFRLTYARVQTPPLLWNVSAEEMQMTLQYLKAIPNSETLVVSRSGPDAAGAMSWLVTFPLSLTNPSQLLVADFADSLVGRSVGVTVSLVATETPRLAGNVQLAFAGQTTTSLSVQATAASVAAALESLSTIKDVDVAVSQAAPNQITWTVSFLALYDLVQPPALLAVATPAPLVGNQAATSVIRVRSRSHSELQAVTMYFPLAVTRAAFQVMWNGVTSATLAFTDMAAADLQLVLAGIPGLGVVQVERYASSTGVGFVWMVLFVEQATSPLPVLSVQFVAAQPAGIVVRIQQYVSTTTPLSGTFSLHSGASCNELTLGGVCVPAVTTALPFNTPAAQLAHELALLPDLTGVTVSSVTAVAGCKYVWQVTFPVEYGAADLIQVDAGGLAGSLVQTSLIRRRRGVGVSGSKVAVEMSTNGQDFSSSGVVFYYTPTPDVHQLTPSHGPLAGGTEVVVRGLNFRNSSSLRCRFGERIVLAATFLNATHLTCITPSGAATGDVLVEVSNHGVGGAAELFTSNRRVFTYDAPLQIDNVFPSLGPALGNFSVVLSGGPFRPTDAIRCRFGTVVVVAAWQSFNEIQCFAPPYTAGIVPLEVTLNDQDYTDAGFPFYYYAEQGVQRIDPIFGPAFSAGTVVTVEGRNFVNSSLLTCRFGFVVTPAQYLSPTRMRCHTPPVSKYSGGLAAAPLSEYRNAYADPGRRGGSVYLFPDAHYYPQYLTRLVAVEVSNNQQDYTLSGVNFLFYQDPELLAVYPPRAYDAASLALFLRGNAFINTTSLTCRVGLDVYNATFVSPQLMLCVVNRSSAYQDARHAASRSREASTALVEVSNNGKDFTSSHVTFEFLGPCPTGLYCPDQLQGRTIDCPRGSYCPGTGNGNFTLCPRGTYQPRKRQPACLRCPVGYHCPHAGLHVPRLCPAGFVCDVTGIEEVDQPCPEGHFCLEGTATASTTCAPQKKSALLVGSAVETQSPTTIRRREQRSASSLVGVGARKSGCWNNATADFGLQLSGKPSRFWSELKQLPLSPDTVFAPIRGRFCLDDSCMRLADADNLRIADESFDYASTSFALRRPVVCPPGTYCHPGTAGNGAMMKNFSLPQPCFESMYCPEGSASPVGFGDCAPGFYCPFGTRIPCPAGTYCPRSGLVSPLACPPGTFNGMVGQSQCTPCPVSYFCPGFNRVMPAFCPPGYACSKPGLSSPNSLCPPGFYCLQGTGTVDPFRNDTRLRPYPCKPGTYCLKGVVADEVRPGDYRYAQNCTEGFYCELGSSSPKGSGLCPPGFTCPAGTAAPIPTDAGKFAQLEGTVSAAQCAPGYYAPTIESTECIPCPPGTTCENDGTSVATVCGPGSYRGSLLADGVSCLACPQGTWSKNWELRGVDECTLCAPGTVCPIDGITHPCTKDDLPTIFKPLAENLSYTECLEKGSAYFYGVLLEPWIDEYGQGPHFVPSRDGGRCFENHQPRGSVLYQRIADFHGALFELSTGVPHQGYGDVNQLPVPNMFQRGSLAIDLPVAQMYAVARNCTQGFFHYGQWFPGTCEADVICAAPETVSTVASQELVSQAQPCPEGFVCDQETTAQTAMAHLCPGGYVCAPGTTPDLSIEAPLGQLHELCPASQYCLEGTAESQKTQNSCPVGYFCPTGTTNPYVGVSANDALRRRLSAVEADPFFDLTHTKYIGEGDIRVVSAHDMRCFSGIDADLESIFNLRTRAGGERVVVNRAVENDVKCARDHRWRLVDLAVRRDECDCEAQAKIVRRVFQLWKCTVAPSQPAPVVYDTTLFGWTQGTNSKTQCLFRDASGAATDVAALIAGGGVAFRTAWTRTSQFQSYAEMKALVATEYAVQVGEIPSTRVAVDPYLFDLNHAIGLIDTFGDETPSLVGFTDSSEQQLIRLDTCGCANLYKCPNGTSSVVSSNDIYDCVKTGSEVLQRVAPIPLTHARLLNASDYADLSGTGAGVGTIVLEPLEVAVVTINTTGISRNITYKDHYQISVYDGCKPCPPRYRCDLKSIPPSCTYPDGDTERGDKLYAKCMADNGDDASVCDLMPFYCDRRNVYKLNADDSNTTTSYAGCCSCERKQMPFYFEDTTSVDLGFPDDKHGYLQFSVSALERSEVTIVVELLHGLYVRDFEQSFTQDRFDLTVFTPSRADYTPLTPSSNTFFAFIEKASFSSTMLPLNLPESSQRILGTMTFASKVESTLLIDRISDIMVGDPQLPAKHGFVRNSQQNSQGILLASSANASDSSANATQVVAPTEYFGLYQVTDPLNTVVRSDTWWDQKLNGSTFLTLPYLPFFSACRGFDSHLWISKLLEAHPDCELVTYDETVEVNQYPWKKKLTPNADKCIIQYTTEVPQGSGKPPVYETHERGISLMCQYEENLEGGAEKSRWYESKKDTTLFYLTRDPASPNDFVAQASDDTGWGRSETFASFVDTDNLVAVQVGDNAGLALAVPQEVYLNLSYYQIEPGRKRLVEASMNFGRLCTVSRSSDIIAKMAKKGISPCTISKATDQIASTAYQLQISWIPLDWFELMNRFQFTVDVYLCFFMLVGLLSIILGMIIYIINRLFTKMKKPPKFRMKILLKNIAVPPCVGITLAVLPMAVMCTFIYAWWYLFSSAAPLTNPNSVSFEGIAGDWLDQISLDSDRVTKYKKGRIGVSLLVAGTYMIVLGAKLMIPDVMDQQFEDSAFKEMAAAPKDPYEVEISEEKEEEDEDEFWDPRRWKRANLLLTTMSFMAFLLVIWEFSYSPMFTANIYAFLVAFKVLRNVVEIVIETVLHEKMLVVPFVVVLSATESMIAMGSADFIGFTFFYFVNLSFVIMERLYFAPLLRHVWGLYPKWKLMVQRKLRKRRRRTREQKAQEEAEWRRVCERIDNQVAGVESVLEGVTGYSVVFTELLLAPIVLLFQVVFSADTKMPELYGVKRTDLLYYSLYALFIIPSNLIMGVFQLNTLELVHGWKIYEYISYQKHRFATRDQRWQLHQTTRDESVHPAFQAIDMMCFSSQFYFLVAFYAFGVLLMMFGTTVCLRYEYSPFGDVLTNLIVVVVTCFARGLELACVRLGDRLGIWKQTKLDGTLDEELATRLALGAGRQKDLERERLELQALNSERFRHRFMERNRPWVLQHLVELFTPRTLQAAGSDGRPTTEYVRDIYHELMNMGEGRRLHGDRSDISSDSEDELEKMRRNWSNVPVNGASKDLALYWLARARKRRTFSKLVAGIIANNKQSACEVCQKSEEGGYTMHVDLANAEGNAQDRTAMDRLIHAFEGEYGEAELDADLWKAYFRKHAAYITLCNVCLSALEQKRLARIVKLPAAQRGKLRGDEFSSDEEDEIQFEPVVVARMSTEGRVLSKWLVAARKRLGGVFPREHARQEMEAYAKKMRAKKARKGKKDHVDSDEEDPSIHWKLQLNEASRALALRWIWQARDTRYAVFRDLAKELRAKLDGMCGKIQEVDDWFFGKDLRLEGIQLMDEAAVLAEEQAKYDEDMAQKVNQVERDIEAFERDKRDATASEVRAFEQIMAKEKSDARQRIDDREKELLELRKKKEVEFVETQKQAREEGSLTPTLVNEHRAFLANMEDERVAEIEKLTRVADEKEKQKRDAFERKLSLAESAIHSRKALAQHRVLSIRKEAMNVLRAREKSWQSRSSGWMEKAGRKITVKEQEDLEAKVNEKKRRKRVLLAT